ncbi:MAG: fumarylacetoacetate hydrolase family protein [Burkholderiaceae bacterium]|jgi:fumarylacetoacetate (FAA) hydrolase|nr:fumarylacetoacetate hydrolase family protein [Burkholderiaceae bacterium]
MKLATYQDGSRDGQLVVVARDLQTAHYATGIASRLQQVLDDWNFISPQLQDLYEALNMGKARHPFAFEPERCMAPLPRAHQWLGAQACASHVALVYPAPGKALPGGRRAVALMAPDGASGFAGPRARIAGLDPAQDIDFEAGIAAITGDVPAGVAAEQGLEAVRLLMLVNSVHLRAVQARELERGFGFAQSQPCRTFSPVAATPDELGEAWRDGRVHLGLQTSWNGRKVGLCDAGSGMQLHFGQLVAQAAKARALHAGCVIGSGALGNLALEASGDRGDLPKGFASIAEKRAVEILQEGAASTGFLQPGDVVRMEMKGRDGVSVFGAIEQTLA